jgi:hypothetical protein
LISILTAPDEAHHHALGLEDCRGVGQGFEVEYWMDCRTQSRARCSVVSCKSFHRAHQFCNFSPPRDSLCRVAAMFERVLISLRGSRGQSAVHPAATVRHRRRLAPAPAPCPRSTSRAEVHGQFALHGVDPLISIDPHPPGSGWCRPPPGRCARGCRLSIALSGTLNRLTAQAPCPVVALRPPLGLGRLRSWQRDWDKPRR